VARQPADIDLDIAGVLEGTDKSSSVTYSWDYLRHYQTLFAPWRHEPINMIEIGVQNGLSLKVWRNYFSRAQIVGIDINPACVRHAGDRIVIETGSQEDPGFLHRICAKYPPAIIVDDGSHLAHHMVYSFKHLFPMLAPGGVYIVEDMEFQFGRFGPQWTGNNSVSAPDYFLELARGRMANNTPIGDVWGDDKYIRESIDSISFFGSAIAIHKRKPRNIAPALAWAEQYLGSIQPSPEQFLRLAEYIIRHDGPPAEAERMIHEAMRLGGRTVVSLRWLVDVLIRQGRFNDAANAAVEFTKLHPDNHGAWGLLAHVERQRDNIDDEFAALEKATALGPEVAHYHDQLSHLLQRRRDFAGALAYAKTAASLMPEFEPWRQRITALENLVAASG
jgi:hypothetical protein